MVEGGVCIGVWECAWLSVVVCVDVLYRGGRCGVIIVDVDARVVVVSRLRMVMIVDGGVC